MLGASDKPERYSNRAVRLLLEHGHQVIPVNPRGGVIAGQNVLQKLEQVEGEVDTLTLYVSPRVSSSLEQAILQLHPTRTIFNPGAENPGLRKVLDENGVRTEEACTLVLLHTGQF